MDGMLIQVFAFVLGSVIGSFLNVCIYRLPRDLSLIRPASTCPQCGQKIRFYDNIPLFSFLILRGRCRTCRNPIPWHYWIVELLAGLLSLALFLRYNLSWPYLIFLVFWMALLAISFIDLHHKIIPDIISLPLAGLGLLTAVFKLNPLPWSDSLFGILGGAGFFYLVALLFRWLRKKEGLGMGDVKLLAMLGAWMGWRPLPYVILLASLSGIFIGGGSLILSRKNLDQRIPFGPFLVLGALVYFFFGKEIVGTWFNLFSLLYR